MTPSLRILADGVDVTEVMRDRLVRLHITDESGFDSDRLEIDLDDRGLTLELPRKGVRLQVWLGFAGLGLWEMGEYLVDEVGHDGPPATLLVRAKGADMLAGLKARKTRSWHEQSMGQILAAIAGEHDLSPRASDALAAEVVAHVDQTDESDLHFLTRLARERDAICKPVHGCLVFVPKGEAKSAAGLALPKVALAARDVGRWSWLSQERDAYRRVIAYWSDKAAATRTEVQAGAGDPVKRLRHDYGSEAEAQRAADAELRRIHRGESTLQLGLPGRPDIAAESRVRITGLKPEIDGEYSVGRAEHTLSGAGLETSLELETPSATEEAA